MANLEKCTVCDEIFDDSLYGEKKEHLFSDVRLCSLTCERAYKAQKKELKAAKKAAKAQRKAEAAAARAAKPKEPNLLADASFNAGAKMGEALVDGAVNYFNSIPSAEERRQQAIAHEEALMADDPEEGMRLRAAREKHEREQQRMLIGTSVAFVVLLTFSGCLLGFLKLLGF